MRTFRLGSRRKATAPLPRKTHTLWRMRYVDYDEAMATLSPAAAVDALREELTGGFDPASDQERQLSLIHI